jgi:3-hydroxyisobutyrate dehydrogenase-like beta-hydroxyacid dehydrogenase
VIETAEAAEILGVSLFDDGQVRDALLDGGALAALRPETIVVLHTTGDPRLPEELAQKAPSGVAILDTTFSGTAAMTALGNLTLLVGGDAAALEAARPILSTYAGTILHVGGLGAGRRLKLLNNLLFAAQFSLAAEILAAAEAMGLDRRQAVEAFGVCSGASYAMERFADAASPQAIVERVKPYLDKDVAVAREALTQLGASLPLAYGAAPWGLETALNGSMQ